MRRVINTLCVCTLLCAQTLAFQPISIPKVEAPKSLYYDTNMPSATDYPKITQIEQYLFNRNYKNEEIKKRLERLEKKLFNKTYQSASLAQRVENIESNIDMAQMAGVNVDELAIIEKRIFNQSFPYDDTNFRLARLEQKLLGAVQNGNFKSRYETVKMAAMSNYSYMDTAQNYYSPKSVRNSRNTQFPYTNFQNSYMNYNPYMATRNSNLYSNLNPLKNPYAMNNYMNMLPTGTAGGGLSKLKNAFGVLNNIVNSGTTTGYTPPLYTQSPYSQIINGGGRQGAIQRRGFYQDFLEDTSGGVGATIID